MERNPRMVRSVGISIAKDDLALLDAVGDATSLGRSTIIALLVNAHRSELRRAATAGTLPAILRGVPARPKRAKKSRGGTE